MKKTLAGLILFASFFVGFKGETFFHNKSDADRLYDVFKKTHARYEYSNINGWGKIGECFCALEDLEKYAKDVAEEMKALKGAKLSRMDEGNLRQVSLEYLDDKRSVTLVVQSIKNGDKKETYLLIDNYLIKGNQNILEERKTVENAFRKVKVKPVVATSIVGSFEGKLKLEEASSIVKEVFKELRAKKVEGLEDVQVVSISGYTRSFGEYIEVGDEKINLQVALRYNSYDDRTYIWIASPLIATEY
ncbi:hypothetical protein O163_04620 [Caldanaerobacter subterraneus subsp. yonseiensis KB-1]|uniref:TATA-box binding protein n=1 Tax=Caldanaerobacter subterraneus subsp. yonseiensis KB-1 TaxID=1388761 RepID=U5CRT0_CALSX|nr:YwmB family TATA-box binding protein [Caldanaerobacter subterraneus]ERM92678.1 hypothetical protein O163_04620 [Caldanaerobacter subterraneus subsp. yonseiensis KB-1]